LPDPGVAIGLAPDVNSDGFVSSLDPLSIINYLNRPEGESSVAAEPAPNAAEDLGATDKASTGSFVQYASAAPLGDANAGDAENPLGGAGEVIPQAESPQPNSDAIDEALTNWEDEGSAPAADELGEADYDPGTWDDALRGLFG
jgi:hypothetical protein